MAEAGQQAPETPPDLTKTASVRTFEQLYSLILAGDVRGVHDHLETNHITPDTYKSLVQIRYYPTLRYSPVATAARSGQLDILKSLIAHGFSPEEPSRNLTGKNEYPIHLASAANQIEVVKCLIEEYGVSVDARDSGDSTPIFWAILTENMTMLKLLIDAGADVNNTFHDTMTPLLFAAFMINCVMCEFLISSGANVNDVGDCGNTPLCLSIRDVATSKILLEAGANMNHINSQGDTPLILATKRNYYKSVELLGSQGADSNICDRTGRTALHHAVDREFLNIAAYLVIDLNVKLNKLDNLGRSPFHMAFYLRNIQLVELLIEAGVDPGKEEIVFEDDPTDLLIPQWFAVVEKCRQTGRNPKTLELLCRCRIRVLLGKDIHSTVEALPLPLIVKNDLTLHFMKSTLEL